MPVRKIIFFFIVIGLVFTINNLARSIYELWHKKDLVVKARQEVEKEKKENRELKSKVILANDQQFVEKEARDKLLLAKPGEDVIVVPTDYLRKNISSKPTIKDDRPNWKKWWDMFTKAP
jgi:cell division protein FtsB